MFLRFYLPMGSFLTCSFFLVSSLVPLISPEVFNVAFHPILPSIICSGSDDRAREPSRSLRFIVYIHQITKSCLFFCPQTESRILQHPCFFGFFWLNLLQMQRLHSELRVSHSSMFCNVVFWLGTNILCELYIRKK